MTDARATLDAIAARDYTPPRRAPLREEAGRVMSTGAEIPAHEPSAQQVALGTAPRPAVVREPPPEPEKQPRRPKPLSYAGRLLAAIESTASPWSAPQLAIETGIPLPRVNVEMSDLRARRLVSSAKRADGKVVHYAYGCAPVSPASSPPPQAGPSFPSPGPDDAGVSDADEIQAALVAFRDRMQRAAPPPLEKRADRISILRGVAQVFALAPGDCIGAELFAIADYLEALP